MFLTLTPNPCIEKTLIIPAFEAGQVYRLPPERVGVNLGGKGINAAHVASRFGASALAIAPIGRHQMDGAMAMAVQEGITPAFIETYAPTRQTINILFGEGQKTEIIEAGTSLAVETGTQLLEKWQEALPSALLASIGGSYPPSTDSTFDWHATLLCDLAARANVPVLYDGKGEPFRRALNSKTPPWAIKPNLEEAAQFWERDFASVADELRAVRDFRKKGIEVVLLSCGDRGLYVGHSGGIEWFEAPKIATISPVGSGDSLVGAFAAKWLETGDVLEAARWGVAAGSANAAQVRAAFVMPTEAEPLLSQIRRMTREIALSG